MCRLVCCFVLLSVGLSAQPKMTVQMYLSTYHKIAIEEMERGAVPASITLAQGIVESAFGNSKLAREAKNHFGIKCHSDWEGEAFYQWDDEEKPSCFRVYCDAKTSYIDHTDFLVKGKRYDFLFELDIKDYLGWAKGLKKAGYATAPDYAEKLVRVVEEYGLSKYDLMQIASAVLVEEKPAPTSHQPVTETKDFEWGATTPIRTNDSELDGKFTVIKRLSPVFPKYYREGIYRQNDLQMVVANVDDTPASLSIKHGLSEKKIRLYNDMNATDQLILYQYVFLEPKKQLYEGERKAWRITDDETMYEIAQAYGIKLSTLEKRNLMKHGEEPAVGEWIYLYGSANKKPRLRDEKPLGIFPDKSNKKKGKKSVHQVEAGETLFGIAKQYGLSVEALRTKNKLTSKALRVGQELKID